MKMRTLILAAAMALAPACAADKPVEQAPTIQPDQGYVLMRSSKARAGGYGATIRFTPVLIRVLGPDEIAMARKTKNSINVVMPDPDTAYGRDNDSFVLFTALKPGTYVVGGVASTSWAVNQVLSSLCMGTVKFEVKPGVVTDLGTLLTADPDKPTSIPELKDIVAGRDNGMAFTLKEVAIRPVTAETEMPELFKALPIVPADYHAVGWIPNYLGAQFGRLPPMAGVLDYDKDGNAVDLKATVTP